MLVIPMSSPMMTRMLGRSAAEALAARPISRVAQRAGRMPLRREGRGRIIFLLCVINTAAARGQRRVKLTEGYGLAVELSTNGCRELFGHGDPLVQRFVERARQGGGGNANHQCAVNGLQRPEQAPLG